MNFRLIFNIKCIFRKTVIVLRIFMLLLIFCTPRIWIGPGRKERKPPISVRFTRKCIATDKKLPQEIWNRTWKTVNHFHSLGKQGRQGALQTCCFSFEIDLLIVFTLLGTKKDKKFSTEWQTFLVVKCLTNTERQLTCPQHVTEHTGVY